MSGLSHKSHGELNQITANIMLSESIDPRKKAIQAGTNRLVNYARGTLSPIIKKNLKLDPNQGLAKGVLRQGWSSPRPATFFCNPPQTCHDPPRNLY